MLDREISSQSDVIKDQLIANYKNSKGIQEEEIIADGYIDLKGRKIADWHLFEQSLNYDETANEQDKAKVQLNGLTRTWIEEHVLLKQS